MTIKVIKLNGRYKLYKEYGCTHAIRFGSWAVEVGHVEKFFRERYGSEYSWKSNNQWKTHWGRSPGRFDSRPFFIGVRNEEMIFLARLAGVI